MRNDPMESARVMGEGLAGKIDHAREGAARSLENAADSVRSTAERGVDAVDNLAEGTAARLDSTARIVRSYSPMCGVQKMVRENPGVSLCVAMAVGLFAGLSVRRN